MEKVLPFLKSRTFALEFITVLLGSLMLTVSAYIAVPLPFTPVPITLQTLAVMLLAGTFGWKRAAGSVALYLCEGAMGLPVFSAATGGIACLLGPKGGYIAGFLVEAAAIGWAADKGFLKGGLSRLLTLTAGTAIQLACGLAWLGLFVGYPNVVALGLVPFIFGELLKVGIAWTMLVRK